MESKFVNFNLPEDQMKAIINRSSNSLFELYTKIVNEFNPNATTQIGVDNIFLYVSYVFKEISSDVYKNMLEEYKKQPK